MREHVIPFAVALGVLVVSLSTWIVLSTIGSSEPRVEHPPVVVEEPEETTEVEPVEAEEPAVVVAEPEVEEPAEEEVAPTPATEKPRPRGTPGAGFAADMASGTLALEAGDAAAAEAAFTRAVAKSTSDVNALLRLAEAQIVLGKTDSAAIQLNTVEELDAAHPELFLLRGRAALTDEQFEDADANFTRAGELATLERAMMAAFFDRRDEATERFTALAQFTDTADVANTFLAAFAEFSTYPDGTKTHLDTLLARAFSTAAFYDLAVAKLQPVLSDQPDFRDAWLLLGYAELGRQDFEEALDAFRTAYDLDPAKPETLFLLGSTYADLADYDQAAQYLLLARQNGFVPETTLLQELADVYFTAGYDAEAAATYAELLTLAPASTAEDYVRPVYLYLEKLDDGRAAWNLAAKAMTELPEDAMSYNLAGWVSVENGYFPEAKSYLDRALELNPSLAGAHLNLGRYYEGVDDTAEAAASYQRALTLDPAGGVGQLARVRIAELNK